MTHLRLAAFTAAATLAAAAQAETIGGLGYADATRNAAAMELVDPTHLQAGQNLNEMAPVDDAAAYDTVRAIIEIPTGTSAKWEINPDDATQLYWEPQDGAPRIVRYLGYPGNYGSIPGTALPQALGGDGDPLDVIVLGQAVPRGEILDVRLIGVLKMLDGGEQDDKLIAVMTEDTPFAGVESLDDLDGAYPGVSQIVSTWFANYKGPDGGMESQGYSGPEEARRVFEQAMRNYRDMAGASGG